MNITAINTFMIYFLFWTYFSYEDVKTNTNLNDIEFTSGAKHSLNIYLQFYVFI